MKKTSDKILDTALRLFNSYGLSKVTLRTIAKEMGISQGNLNYHYKKRDDIIEALYFQLVKSIDETMASLMQNNSGQLNLKTMLSSSTHIMSDFYDYRFLFLDFVQVMREHKAIKAHYLKLGEMREVQFMGMFAFLIENKIMREEKFPNEYKYLYSRFQILGDFWISSAEVMNKKITKETVNQYAFILSQSIYPYLTEKGEKEYQAIFSIQV